MPFHTVSNGRSQKAPPSSSSESVGGARMPLLPRSQCEELYLEKPQCYRFFSSFSEVLKQLWNRTREIQFHKGGRRRVGRIQGGGGRGLFPSLSFSPGHINIDLFAPPLSLQRLVKQKPPPSVLHQEFLLAAATGGRRRRRRRRNGHIPV